MYTLECWRKTVSVDRISLGGPVTVAMPARFDFIGGWTDTPPYYFDNDAAVLNSTLVLLPEKGNAFQGRDALAAISVTVRPSKSFMTIENGCILPDIRSHIVLRKTLEFLSLDSPDIAVDISNSIPPGSGLGGSSLLTACILGALVAYYQGAGYLRRHLCELVNNVLLIEQLMQSGGGWQDQIGGIFPGVKLISTRPASSCGYRIDYLPRGEGLLDGRSLVIDTRVQRKAVKILASIRQKYVERDRRTLEMLAQIARNARTGFSLLAQGDVRSFSGLLSDSWDRVNEIESGTIEIADRLRELCRNALIGMKIGGAGGGGFILAIFEDEERKEFHRDLVRKEFPGCLLYDPLFGGPGMTVYSAGEDGSPFMPPLYRTGRTRALRYTGDRIIEKPSIEIP
jgi:fucokinase